MRAIRTLDDVRVVLQEIMAWKDKLEFTSWDFHRKRITNASQAVNYHDYIIKGQLDEAIAGLGGGGGGFGTLYYTIEFTNSGEVSTGTDVCGPYCVPRYGEGIPLEAYICAVIPPVGSSLAAEI